MDNKYSKVLTIALIVIIVGIVITLGYVGYRVLTEKKTEENYTNAANEFENAVLGGSSGKATGGNSTLNAINSSGNTSSKKYMEDYEIIGTIEIPKTGLKCAVLSETTPRSLEIAVTVIYPAGTKLNVPGQNVVIYGHNYRNKLFFSKNNDLENGDKIYLLDQEGNKVTYEVFDKFETTSTDTSFYPAVAEEIGNKCEVTLSTCTDDASTTERRIIVRAREI